MEKLVPKDIENILSLTPLQEGMLFHYLKDPRSDIYFEQFSLEISGEIDRQIFEKTWNVVIQANEMLRTVFRWEKLEKPSQVILKKHPCKIRFHDFSDIDDVQKKTVLAEIKANDRDKGFDLTHVPFRVTLCKLDEKKCEMIISNHHILYDGWSNGILLKEFFSAYHALSKGKQAVPIIAKPSFKEYIKWLQSRDRKKQEFYWQEYLAGFETAAELPIKRKKKEATGTGDYVIILGEDISNKLAAFIKNNKVTLASVFYSAWGLLLQRYCGSEDILFGTAVSGRSANLKGIEDMVGLFINTIPLRINTYPGETIINAVSRTDQLLREREEFEHTPLVDIGYRDVTSGRDVARNGSTLFDTIVVIENYPLDDFVHGRDVARNGSMTIHSYSMVETTHYDLTVGIMPFNEIEIKFSFKQELFENDVIKNLAGHLKTIIQKMIEQPETALSQLEIISIEEKNRILNEFNNTATEYPRDKTIHQLFTEQVAKTPDYIAIVGNADVEAKKRRREEEKNVGAGPRVCPVNLTYHQLNEQSNHLAGVLIEKGVLPDNIVGIMMERSVEMIIGIMGILKSGGAYMPIDPEYPQERIDYMLKDSGAKILIIKSEARISKYETNPNVLKINDQNKNIEDLMVLNLDHLNLISIKGCPRRGLQHSAFDIPRTQHSNHLAYVIYTSGSTGRPKGVMVKHRNVVRLVKGTNYIEFLPGESILQTGAMEFDASTFEVWGSLLNGLKLVLVNKETILIPEKLKAALQGFAVSTIWMTSLLFNQMLQEDIEIFAGLKNLLIGGDVLSPSHIGRLRSRYPWLNVINGYGPTENTTFSTTFLIQQEYTDSIPIGKPIANSTIYIVDRYNQLQPIGVPGELLVGGDGIARGYLNNPELTCKKFRPLMPQMTLMSLIKNKNSDLRANFQRSSFSIQNSILYCTGDLSRWLSDGNIEFLGRIDQQVKIRGFRIELGEIENQLLKHKHIKEAVMIINEDAIKDKSLTAYIISTKELIESELREYMQEKLPEYMIPSHLVQLDKIPLTPNGKLDRKALPKPELKTGDSYNEPRDEIEKKLEVIWSEVLGQTIIGIDDNFFYLGGHSLKATILVSKIHKVFQVNVPLTEIFKTPTIRRLANYIKTAITDKYVSIDPVEKKGYYSLSAAQKRLYILYQMDQQGVGYNIPSFQVLEGEIDKEKLEYTFRQLIHRHESLKTSFQMINDEPVQRIHDEVEFEIEYLATEGTEDTERKIHHSSFVMQRFLHFIRAFDLSRAPLMRVGLLKEKGDIHILMVDMHHIISDGTSMNILVKDFMDLYQGKESPELRVHYKDFSAWQDNEKQAESLKRQEKYWLNEFAGEIPVLELPADYPRPVVQSFEGNRIAFEIDKETTGVLKTLALEIGATMYMVLLSLYTVFLAKVTNQEDIVVGSPIAGRRHADLEKIIGMFVNTLALRNFLSGEKRFMDFLSEVKEKTLKVFENQDYQYEDLVGHIVMNRDVSRNPLFDTMLALQNTGSQKIDIPGLKLSPYPYENKTAKFDLSLTALETEEKLLFNFEYSTKLFKEETINRFSTYFKNVVNSALENKDRRISDFEIITEEEKKRILVDFNNTGAEYPKDKTIPQLFAEQVSKSPDHIAVIGHGLTKGEEKNSDIETLRATSLQIQMSYHKLIEQSKRLAGLLIEKGVLPDTIVGIMMERSIEMIIGIMSILKAGGAYLPIDPDYPQERIDYMLKDSGAKLLVITSDKEGEKVGKWEGEKVLLESIWHPSNYFSLQHLSSIIHRSNHLAYLIYTSGTTGNPKGAMIEHRNLDNYVYWFCNKVCLCVDDRTILTSSFAFDLGYTTVFPSLLGGSRLHVVSRETYLSAEHLLNYINIHKITYLKLTPSLFSAIVESPGFNIENIKRLRLIVLGGEAIKVDDVAKAWIVRPTLPLMNHYGPTETTIGCIAQLIDFDQFEKFEERPTIGNPIANMKAVILDKDWNLVPIGVPGELYVSGAGVGRGYLNNPVLTAERFQRNVISQLSLVTRDKQIVNSHLSSVNGKIQTDNNPLNFPNDQYLMTNDYLYKTGDLARWLPGGTVEFLGRMDQQVKIRGFRIELQEIEARLLAHKSIKEVAVVDREYSGGDKYLCAYIVCQEKERKSQPAELREFILEKLPEYMVPAYFIEIEKIPLTANGKLNKKLLPGPELKTVDSGSRPRNYIEEKLVEIWNDILERKDQPVGIDDNFFQVGGHSLKAIILISRMHKAFHFHIPLGEVFKRPTIRGLAAYYILENVKQSYAAIGPVEKKEYYELSSAQKRLYFLQQMDETGTVYNLPFAAILEGVLDKDKLASVFLSLVQRHESLRTSFVMVADRPVQRIYDENEALFQLTYADAAEKEHNSTWVRAFDLAQAPLMRVELLKLAVQKHLLRVDMHHIISDGISRSVLAEELMSYYHGRELPPLRLQYKDFAAWQNSREATVAYWQEQFADEIPVLDLSTDYPRPMVQNFAGDRLTFETEKETAAALKTMAMEEGVTLYMILLSLYYIFLAKLSNQEDIIVGTPTAGRRHADLERIIGMFVNTLALRNYPNGEKKFCDFLNEIKEMSLQAFENQDYQYEKLVELLPVTRDAGRNPLFDTMFVLQNFDRQKIEIPGLKLTPYEYENKTTKFDLTLLGVEKEDKLFFTFEYNTKLFREETVNCFITYFKNVVNGVIENKERRISDFEIITGEEKKRILVDFNDTAVDYPNDKTIHQLFAEQTSKTPDHIAVVVAVKGEEKKRRREEEKIGRVKTLRATSLQYQINYQHQMTYHQLNEQSGRLAGLLIEKGVLPDNIVGIMMERSVEMIIGIMGILKSGGAYMPIDPDYPQERIDYMLKDSGTKLLAVANDQEGEKKRRWEGELLAVANGSEGEKLRRWEVKKNSSSFLTSYLPNFLTSYPFSLAYVIYTSGTTGKPKGSLIEHRNVVRLMFNDHFQFDFNDQDVWTMFHSFCFDFSVWEMYGALLYGGKLVIIPLLTAKDPGLFIEILKKEKVTVLNQTPAAFYNLDQKDSESPGNSGKLWALRYVIFGGDVLKPSKLERWKAKYPAAKLINMFGITETTVHVTYKEITEREIQGKISNIGKPIPTLSTYVMDRSLMLAPIDVRGELLVGGEGVCRGYLNRPELTAERFIENPYTRGERLYRSGDLGRIVDNGDMEYLGRIDHQVKIRGFRIELGEIENRLLKNEKVKEAIVISGESAYLCAYIVPAAPDILSISELRDHLSLSLPAYMIPSYFMMMEKIPMTSNGKIDRGSLPMPAAEGDDEYIAPRDEVEKKLVEIWKKALKLEKVGIRDSYFNLGGDSMKAIKMLSLMNEAFAANLKIVDLFTNETIEKLALRVREERFSAKDAQREEAIRDIEQLKTRVLETNKLCLEEIEDLYPMSDIEKGMVYHSLKEPGRAVYHDQMVHHVVYKDFDPLRFKQAVALMVEKHPILRTCFHIGEFEEEVQVVYKKCRLDVIHYDISHLDRTGQEQYIIKYTAEDRQMPFNFSDPPLWRLRTFGLNKDNIVVLWVCHHAIIDGWSDASFKTELNHIYLKLKTNPDFVPGTLKSSYKEFIIEQVAYKKKQEIQDFWKNELTDYKRLRFDSGKKDGEDDDAMKEYREYRSDLGNEFAAKLNLAAAQYNTRLKHLCFGAYLYMLSMLTYDNDVTAGLVTNNRPLCEDGEKILGCFLNTVPVRFTVPVNIAWSDYMRMVDNKILELSNYDRLSFFEIIELIGEKGYGQNPVFDTLFNFVEFHVYDESIRPEVARNRASADSAGFSIAGRVSTNTFFNFTINTTLGFYLECTYSHSRVGDEMPFKLCHYFERILNRFLKEPEAIARKEDLIPGEEKQKLLYEFNDTAAKFPREKTIHQLLEEQVERTPYHIAIFGHGRTRTKEEEKNDVDPFGRINAFSGVNLSYRELNEQSNLLANVLQTKGVGPDTIVGIMMERSIEMVIGILGILKAGGAYLPINPKNPQERTRYMLKDSGTKLLAIANGLEGEKVGRWEGETMYLEEISRFQKSSSYPLNSSNLAYIIYTSGSTGNPKGVPITHANLCPLLHWGYKNLGIGSNDRTLQNLSYYFDWSVWEIFITLTTGAKLYMVSDEVLLNPADCIPFMKEKDITILHVTPIQCQHIISSGDKLETLKYLFLGAEKLTVDLLRRSFASVKEECRVFNMYGPTEATIISAVLEIKRGDESRFEKENLWGVPIGKPVANGPLLVLDNHLQLCPVYVTGELYIAGDGIAEGYLNNPELTSEKFISFPYFLTSSLPNSPLYRTGDLCKWLSDGNIEFLGRIDHQVKIRGFRIELGEIENQLLKHKHIKEAVVVINEDAITDKNLTAYIISTEEVHEIELREYLQQNLPDYLIPSHFVQLEKIPLNPNGKLDRNVLPKPGLKAGESYIAPGNEIEKKLVEIWSEVLGRDEFHRIQLNETIGINDNFFHLGGHSLKATILSSKIHKTFNANIPLSKIFTIPTIRGLANYIKSALQEKYLSIEPIEKKDYYSLSSAQKRLYILDEMDRQGVGYNIPSFSILEGEINQDRLAQTFKLLIARHESLRTSFHMINDEPVQRVHSEVEFEIEYKNCNLSTDYTDYTDGDDDKNNILQHSAFNTQRIQSFIRSFIQPFNLLKAPLLRVGLVKEKKDRHILMVDMHHIISDGTSMNILVKDFMALYQDKYLPELRVQYKDFSAWQNNEKEQVSMKRQENFWLNEFAGDIPVLELPTDYARPSVQSFEGNSIQFEIDKETTGVLKNLALETDATMYMILLAIYNVFLSKVTDQEDIVVGSPIAGRRHADLEKIIGMFINTLALRNYPSGEKLFVEFLQELKEKTLKAFENQDYLYEDLVERMTISRDTSRNPLFDTMFAFQNMEIAEINIPGLKLSPYPYENKTAKFDLTLTAVEAEEKLFFNFEYSSKLFKAETLKRFITYFKNVLNGVIENKNRKIADFEIITEGEKKRILVDFNDTEAEYPKDKTIHQLFEEQAAKTPDYIAVVGAEGGEEKNGGVETLRATSLRLIKTPQQITYRQLNEQSNQLAGLLIEKGVLPDNIVGIMMERSIEMIIGIFGILKSGGAYLPIDPEYPQDRIDYMLKDSGAKMIIGRAEFVFSCFFTASSLPRFLASNSSDLAYIIYTSGSTGRPKGVMIEHPSAVNLLFAMQNQYPFTPADTYLLKTSYTFDVSVTELFGWFMGDMGGGKLAILEKNGEKDPQIIFDWIYQHHVTHINFVPSMFNSFLDFMNEKNKNQLRSLKYIFLAGEALIPAQVKKFRTLNTTIALENLYGPTEGTVYSSYYSLHEWNGLENVPIGKPLPNIKLYILNKYNHLQPLGIPGELYISGDGVARGYLNRPELTSIKFLSAPSVSSVAKIYKTGDLARWLQDGNIEFLGRIDQQVKIRGFRIELGEIENQLLKHKYIKEAVVVINEDAIKDKNLTAYIISSKVLSEIELREFLQQKLPEYMIPSHFVPLNKIPLTPNGKLDRKALPKPEWKAGECYIAPRDAIEKKLAVIWSEVLDQTSIGIDDNFFHLGGHSLKATILVSKIHKVFQVNMPLAEIFKTPTIRNLSNYIKASVKENYLSIEPVEKQKYYSLSSAQKRLYILYQMDQQGVGYNIPSFQVLEGEIDKEKLEYTFWQLIHRHESLRTSFHMLNNEPVQRIHDEVEFEIEYLATEGTEDTERKIHHSSFIIHNFIRAFELSKAPLLRVGLQKIEKDKHILMVDMHHIISDGTSINILVKDFMAMYQGENLSELQVQYKDFSNWQKDEKQAESLKLQGEYWLNEFASEMLVLELPTDYPRPAVQRFEGSSIDFEIDKETTVVLKTLALEIGATMYMVLLSLYTVFLAKVTNQEDIVVGSPIAGRRHTDLEETIGMFVNTLALRNFLSGEKRFLDFLSEVKEKTLKVFENQDYQYEDLVEKVTLTRDTSRNPLFDTMFVLQNMEIAEISIPGLKLSPYPYKNKTSKFDLTLSGVEEQDKLLFTFEYGTKLFKEETIERFITYFKNVVSDVIENKNRKIADYEIITEEEKKRILVDFNDTEAEYPKDKTIHGLFAEQATQIPDAVALVARETRENHEKNVETLRATSLQYQYQITYHELNNQSNCLAGLLIEEGVQPDTIVGIMIERSFEMIIGIMGILKAGGAYLPIDPEYPQERIDYMLKDSKAKLTINYEFLKKAPQAPLQHSAFITQHSNHLAYVIYTSGSTGKPKGVMIEHQSAVNLLYAMQKKYPLNISDSYLLKTSYVFDVSITELFGWYMGGSRLVILEKDGHKDPGVIVDIIEKNYVTHINFVPSMFNIFIDYLSEINMGPLSSLKYIFLAGETLLPESIARFRNLNKIITLENVYGPTENTVYSSKYSLSTWKGIGSIPVGKPLPNIGLHILNKYYHLQPIGVTGELYISGDNVARGYLNNPVLTSERFINFHHSSFDIPPFHHSKCYRTGDLARWLPDGNIEFLGRIDHQVKIRGYRIELEEIENHLLKHEKVKEAVILAREDINGEKYITAYYVSDIDISESELRKYLLNNLPDYMIPSYFVHLQKIPLTPSGKINRPALPKPELKSGEGYIAPRDEIEMELLWVWSEILSKDSSQAVQFQAKIGIDDNFFQLGGHSLKANLLAAKLHHQFDVKVPLIEIFKSPTIRKLSEYLKLAKQDKYKTIDILEKREYYPLSSSQVRIYIQQQLELNGTSYNMPSVFLLKGELDRYKLENALNKLIERHEILRTSFESVKGEIIQKIHNAVSIKIEYYNCGEEEAIERVKYLVKPFDLSRAPLFRFELLYICKKKYFIFIDMHHIISDGSSIEIFINDLISLYEEKNILPLLVQYKDYAAWQKKQFHGEVLKAQEEYWLRKLEGFEFTQLPFDHFDLYTYVEGKAEYLEIATSLYDQIETFCNEYKITKFIFMITVFEIILAKKIDQADITIGIPALIRNHPDLKNIIGVFLNVLLIRSRIDEEDKFINNLLNNKKTVLEALSNQDYPYELLDSRIKTKESSFIKKNNLFSILFNYFPLESNKEISRTDFEIFPMETQEISPKYDLTLYVYDFSDLKALKLNLVYKSNIYEVDSIKVFLTGIMDIIRHVLINEEIILSQITFSDEMQETNLDDYDVEFEKMYENQI